MGFYDDMAAFALSSLTEFGQPVSIQQQGPKTTNNAGISVPNNPPPMVTVGLLLDYTFRQYGNEVAKGSYVQAADKQLYIPATTTPPQVQDIVTVAGNVWAIVNIKQVNPAGTPVLYELWLKR